MASGDSGVPYAVGVPFSFNVASTFFSAEFMENSLGGVEDDNGPGVVTEATPPKATYPSAGDPVREATRPWGADPTATLISGRIFSASYILGRLVVLGAVREEVVPVPGPVTAVGAMFDFPVGNVIIVLSANHDRETNVASSGPGVLPGVEPGGIRGAPTRLVVPTESVYFDLCEDGPPVGDEDPYPTSPGVTPGVGR